MATSLPPGSTLSQKTMWKMIEEATSLTLVIAYTGSHTCTHMCFTFLYTQIKTINTDNTASTYIYERNSNLNFR